MFHSVGLLHRSFGISPTQLSLFIDAAAARYRDVPFHNFRHVFTVTLTAWRFITLSPELGEVLHDVDRLVIAATLPSHQSLRVIITFTNIFSSHAPTRVPPPPRPARHLAAWLLAPPADARVQLLR